MHFSTHQLFVTTILWASLLNWDIVQAGPIVTTKLGSIQGSTLTSDEGANFFAFRGIPYAKPPVKNLRFSPPHRFDEAYESVLKATEDGNSCIQYNRFAKEFSGDEDCLYLNVYTPEFFTKPDSPDFPELLPVMFWIHGGGFFMGSGAFGEYGPHMLMDRNVILVTINYRLGPFGFLSTLDGASPGNYGLLDQVMALKWVRDNIAFFHGDPNKVTIFGASAGGMSVGFHLLSPLSKGLFHAAIAQSGSALAEYLVSNDKTTSLHFAQDVAQRMNCPTDNNKKMIQCLKKKPALDLIMKSAITVDNYIAESADITAFKAVIDTAYGEKSFLPDFPKNLLEKKQFNAVPLMTGANKDEGILLLPTIQGFGGLMDFGKNHIPVILKNNAPSLFISEEHGLKASQIVAEKYFQNLEETDLKLKLLAVSKFLGDFYLTYMMDVLNDYFAKYNVPTYVYKLTHKGERSYAELLQPNPLFSEDLQIVTHGDELQNLFRSETFKCSIPPREENRQITDIMLTLWTNFAKTKMPTMNGSAYDHPTFKWEPLTSDDRHYLELNSKPHMVNGHLSCNYDTLKNAYDVATIHKDEL